MSAEGSSTPLPMSDFDYELPAELIAQVPLERRSDSRLLVLDRARPEVRHSKFAQLPDFLSPGDLLVFNDTRVLPARLLGSRQSGGAVEFLLLRRIDGRRWRALAKPAARLRVGETISIRSRADGPDSSVEIVGKFTEGQVEIELAEEIEQHLDRFGQMPLPPYITQRLEDGERYQTTYSRIEGSAAAPTAGLHFTPDTMAALAGRGIDTGFVTLHVGLDTFRPVTEDDARDHAIHRESFEVGAEVIQKMDRAREHGNRIVAVGTTTARTLETWSDLADRMGRVPYAGESDIYITPGFRWKTVDALLTNFHLPRSTLLLMVSALAGRERILDAYMRAIEERYRFFSFGDAMLIL